MKPELRFETKTVHMADPGQEASVPDLMGSLILQNNLEFHLDDPEEIYAGYGRCKNAYPYRQQNCYNRKLQDREMETAVLENDFLQAVFLPMLGGRLWSLWDKKAGRNLLYTNDVIRFSNLAVRNAWFSGGVEWNMGVIGHTPFTAAPLFTAVTKDNGTPVLRMYEYERIRGVVYQMDFWLGEKDRFLNARMRITNDTDETIPMYWWSNMAVPEQEGGRIIVPAKQAYTYKDGGVYKVEIPVVDEVDITRYGNIPSSVDYFFDIPQDRPKYIAHVDGNGYGLLQMSTMRQQSRKLFSWGHKRAADHWQEFLTENGGRYVEIQAGLPKTQYGCLPMPPHTKWEWMERYGALQLSGEETEMEFEPLRDRLTERVTGEGAWQEMEEILLHTEELAEKEAKPVYPGSRYAALHDAVRKWEGKTALPAHLDFGTIGEGQRSWIAFLETGNFPEQEPMDVPGDFLTEEAFFDRLLETMPQNEDNWYAHYQLGLFWFRREEWEKAKESFEKSVRLSENPWTCHGMACVQYALGCPKEAAAAMSRGIAMRTDDLSYVKEGFKLLLLCEAFSELLELYEKLPDETAREGRICFDRIYALYQTGKTGEAYGLLCAGEGLVPDDVREGETSVGSLWQEMHRELFGTEEEIPYRFDFTAV